MFIALFFLDFVGRVLSPQRRIRGTVAWRAVAASLPEVILFFVIWQYLSNRDTFLKSKNGFAAPAFSGYNFVSHFSTILGLALERSAYGDLYRSSAQDGAKRICYRILNSISSAFSRLFEGYKNTID